MNELICSVCNCPVLPGEQSFFRGFEGSHLGFSTCLYRWKNDGNVDVGALENRLTMWTAYARAENFEVPHKRGLEVRWEKIRGQRYFDNFSFAPHSTHYLCQKMSDVALRSGGVVPGCCCTGHICNKEGIK